MTSYALARPWRLDIDAFSRATGLHPDGVRRFVTLGLVEASRDSTGALWFTPGELAAVARLQRLRSGFALNYAALGLVVDLLDRLARAESGRRRTPAPASSAGASSTGARRWT